MATKKISQANGGVPLFGHSTYRRVFDDPDLLQHDQVWGAAGRWNDVFGIEPLRLAPGNGSFVTKLNRR